MRLEQSTAEVRASTAAAYSLATVCASYVRSADTFSRGGRMGGG